MKREPRFKPNEVIQDKHGNLYKIVSLLNPGQSPPRYKVDPLKEVVETVSYMYAYICREIEENDEYELSDEFKKRKAVESEVEDWLG